MNRLLLTLIMGLLLIASTSLAQSANTADETAVKQVITDQTDAFFAKDREKWARCWVHEPYISWTAQGGADRVLTVSGWEAYSNMFDGYFQDPTPSQTKVVSENMQVTVLDKVATVTFLQTRQNPTRPLKSREVRVLEKQGNDWKLVYVYSRNVD
jgi:ketosteroid isomerase-like protein